MEPDKNIKRVIGEQSRRRVSAGMSIKSAPKTTIQFSKGAPRRNFSISSRTKWTVPVITEQVHKQKPVPKEFHVALTPGKY